MTFCLGERKQKRPVNQNTNCCDWLSHIIIFIGSPPSLACREPWTRTQRLADTKEKQGNQLPAWHTRMSRGLLPAVSQARPACIPPQPNQQTLGSSFSWPLLCFLGKILCYPQKTSGVTSVSLLLFSLLYHKRCLGSITQAWSSKKCPNKMHGTGISSSLPSLAFLDHILHSHNSLELSSSARKWFWSKDTEPNTIRLGKSTPRLLHMSFNIELDKWPIPVSAKWSAWLFTACTISLSTRA